MSGTARRYDIPESGLGREDNPINEMIGATNRVLHVNI